MSLFGTLALSVVCDTIGPVSQVVARNHGASPVLVSHTGVPLTRSTTFRFTLDPSREQERQLLAHAGAARLAYNHQLGRVKTNLDQRAAERSYGTAEADLTPSLSWSKVSFINEMNAWKDGRATDARVSIDADGTSHHERGPGSEPAQDPRQGARAAGRQPRTRTPGGVRVKGSR